MVALALFTLTACAGRTEPTTELQVGAPASTTDPGTTEPAAPRTAQPAPSDVAHPTGPAPGLSPVAPPAPEGFREVPVEQVDAKALPETYTDRRVWVSPDGTSLLLHAVAPDSCGRVAGRVEQETGSLVRVLLSPLAQPQGGPDGPVCSTALTPIPVSVGLGAPLGGRTVVVSEGP